MPAELCEIGTDSHKDLLPLHCTTSKSTVHWVVPLYVLVYTACLPHPVLDPACEAMQRQQRHLLGPASCPTLSMDPACEANAEAAALLFGPCWSSSHTLQKLVCACATMEISLVTSLDSLPVCMVAKMDMRGLVRHAEGQGRMRFARSLCPTSSPKCL